MSDLLTSGTFVQLGSLPYYDMNIGLDPDQVIGDQNHFTISSPWQTVKARFDDSMAIANGMLDKLVGFDGESGYLGNLNAILSDYAVPEYAPISASIPDMNLTVQEMPTLGNAPTLEAIPDLDATAPSLAELPSVDVSNLQPAVAPDEVNATMNWSEASYSSGVYADLLSRVLSDLQAGATGLDATVEAEIWARAIARQVTENDRAYQEAENYFAARGFTLPPGALAARIAEVSDAISRNNTDLNGKIAIEQAELAQKNSQFIITQAVVLEGIIRDFSAKLSDRDLEYQKSVADLVLQNYIEKVKAYTAVAEANKIYVEVQVEVLKGTIEHNKGLVSNYVGLIQAYAANVDALASKNKSSTDGYLGEVQAFSAKHKTLNADRLAEIEVYRAEISKADIALREQLATIEAGLKGYEAEMSTREKVATSMANIASQAVASALTSVNASASLGYDSSERMSETWSHGEDRSERISISGSLHESHSYQEPTA